MWFGNLVTLTSWDDDWLKEGFATWAAYLAMNNISKQFISWDVNINFIRNNIEAGIRTDYHDPIQLVFQDTNTVNEMGLIVHETSVPKAASLIWMLENYIGREEFKNGIRLFLKRYEYLNANEVNLWNSFNTNFKVEKFMNSWIEKQGCPLVTISEEKKNKEESEYLIIKQKRFLSSDKENNTIWEIPITFSWGETVLMTQREIRIQKKSAVYKINMGCNSFYRTFYNLQNFYNLLNSPLNVEDRYNLFNDIFAFCNAKMVKVLDVLNLCEVLKNETNPEILKSIFYNLNKFRSLWYDNKRLLDLLKKIFFNLVGSRVLDIDIFTKEVNSDSLTTNSLIVTNAMKFKDNRIFDRLQAAYSQWWDVNPEFIKSVFISVIDEEYEKVFELAKDIYTFHNDRIYALSALAAISCPDNLLNVMKRYHMFNNRYSIHFFLFLGSNEKNREIILDFICDNFDDIRDHMKDDRQFSLIIERVLSRASTRPFADKVINLLNTKKTKKIEMAINKAIDKIKWNFEFKEFNSDLNKIN